MNLNLPLVSVFTFCKNCEKSIRRCVDSVLSQPYPNIEHIIQDGASTDGTLEILQEYAQRNQERIKLISEVDISAAVGFYRALKRCTGDIIGSCLSDEEYLPHAVTWAVNNFSKYPLAGAIHGDIYNTDIEGNVLHLNPSGPFDMLRYLSQRMTPHFAASFFRRNALDEIGLYSRNWDFSIGEFELWVRLAMRYEIVYIPEVITKYARYQGQLSENYGIQRTAIQGIEEFLSVLFDEPAIPDRVHDMRIPALAGFHIYAAKTCAKFQDYWEAKRHYEEAIKYPQDQNELKEVVIKMLEHGVSLLQQGKPSEALEYINLTLLSRITIDDMHYARAVTLAQLGRTKEAQRAANAELQRHPNHPGCLKLIEILSGYSLSGSDSGTHII